MTNKWTTLVEEQTEKANDAISELLESSAGTSAHSSRHKVIASLMAVVGLVLVGLGVYPLLSENLGGEVFQADLGDEFNIFTDAEPVADVGEADVVPTVPLAESDPDLPETETDPLDDFFTDPAANPLPVSDVEEDEFSDINFDELYEDSAEFPAAPETPVVPQETAVPFPMNQHTGSVDPQVVVLGESNSGEIPTSVHAAAQEVPESGATAWFAVAGALLLAFAFRRKKMFA